MHYIVSSRETTEACYVHGKKELAKRLAKALEGASVGIFVIEGEDWTADLSPWKAPEVFKGEPAFAGGADAYLEFLCSYVILQTEKKLQLTVKKRALIGYSLAGLFSVYALYRTTFFTNIASVSGSLWYDGFIDFMLKNETLCKPERAYFSVGIKEKKTRNDRMSKVEDQTLQAKRRLEEMGVSCFFELNEGNHFYQVEERIEKAARWLYSPF